MIKNYINKPNIIKIIVILSHSSELYILLKMKTIEIGSRGPYDDIQFTISKKPNKYGVLYYFKQRIYLVKNAPITNYSLWASDEGVPHLVIDSDNELCEELRLLCIAAKDQDNELDFKDYTNERLFIKLNKSCEKIVPNCELTFCISVFGIFKKTGGKSFLQMDVTEQMTRKISLLGKRPSPPVSNVEEDASAKRLNYIPNSLAFELDSAW